MLISNQLEIMGLYVPRCDISLKGLASRCENSTFLLPGLLLSVFRPLSAQFRAISAPPIRFSKIALFRGVTIGTTDTGPYPNLTRFRASSFWQKKVHFSKIQSGRAGAAIAALDRLISKYDAAQNLAALVPFVGNWPPLKKTPKIYLPKTVFRNLVQSCQNSS